jgi:hypothetical protein
MRDRNYCVPQTLRKRHEEPEKLLMGLFERQRKAWLDKQRSIGNLIGGSLYRSEFDADTRITSAKPGRNR